MPVNPKQECLQLNPEASCQRVWRKNRPAGFAVFVGSKEVAVAGSARKAWDKALWKMKQEIKK